MNDSTWFWLGVVVGWMVGISLWIVAVVTDTGTSIMGGF